VLTESVFVGEKDTLSRNLFLLISNSILYIRKQLWHASQLNQWKFFIFYKN